MNDSSGQRTVHTRRDGTRAVDWVSDKLDPARERARSLKVL